MSTSRSRWSAIIAEHSLSDLPVVRFCARRGVSTTAFYRWRRALRAGRPSSRGRRSDSGAAIFVEAVVADAAPDSARGASASGAPIVELGSGRRIVVPHDFDEKTLARLVLALERLDASMKEARP